VDGLVLHTRWTDAMKKVGFEVRPKIDPRMGTAVLAMSMRF
jgi:hypothetical protein